jgi:two-component system chemotaxis sensor kinase CheA
MIDRDFLQIFIVEAVEILDSFEASCIRLEKNPDSSVLNELFRAAHNLKGSARSVGLAQFGAFVHLVEDLITQMKAGKVAKDHDAVGLLLDCQGILVVWVEALHKNPNFEPVLTSIKARLEQLLGTGEETSPSESGFGLFDEPQASSVSLLSESEPVEDSEEPTLLEAVATEAVTDPSATTISHQSQPQVVNRAVEQASHDDTIRVSLKRLDSLMRLIGELSIQHSIIANAIDNKRLESPSFLEAIALAKKVIQDLQAESMTLRMQPLGSLFQRLERVALDVARQQGKKIEVVLKGSDVELDKTVLEHMKDPLVHIIRNAVDHGIEGIEDAEQRKKFGKAPVARLVIEGIQTASHVSIRVTDDGRGLDRQKIRQKAIEKGLLDKSVEPDESEILRYIFLPGFSTAAKVTDVSGRGVGMDVVKKAVEELNGEIDIQSSAGQGTTFVIQLPSTLSILDAIVVALADERYAIPVRDVEEVVDLSSLQLETTAQKGRVINLRGRVLPVELLSDYLPVKSQRPLPSAATGSVALITTVNRSTVAFEVDAIDGQQSIVVRKLDGGMERVPGLSGGTILANGEPSMILHLPHLVKSYLNRVA